VVTDRLGDFGDVGNAPAADRDRHSLPRPHFLPEIEPAELTLDGGRNIGCALDVESLANSNHSGEAHRKLRKLTAGGSCNRRSSV
jgi:hypothetical protein